MHCPPLSRRPAGLLVGLLLVTGCGGGDSVRDAPPAAQRPRPELRPVSEVPRTDPSIRRLLVLGLDGATWDLLDPLLEAGRLPHLAALIDAGSRAELITMEPTLSPAIWTTIATGVTPDVHGILGFDGVPGQSMTTLPNARMRKRKAYWNVLSDFGVTTGTVGWWASWPADPLVDGSFLVSDRVPYTRMEAAIDRADLDPGDIWPPELAEQVVPRVQRPDDIEPEVVRDFLGFGPEEMKERILDAEYRMGSLLPEFKFVHPSDRSTIRIARTAFADHPVEVLSVYITGIDTMSHLAWHFAFPDKFPRYRIPEEEIARFSGLIDRYYEQADEWLGQLLDAVGPGTTVLVLSDHGFGPTGNLPWSGGHGRITPGAPIAPRGVLILSGPGTAAGPNRLERAHVLDVMPTILHLFGLPAAEDMPGRVLVDALSPDARGMAPRVATYETIGTWRDPAATLPVDPAGDAQRLERLRALGYVQ